MTHLEQDELALLLMMNDQKSCIDLIHENGPDLLTAFFEDPQTDDSCFLSPGRRHVPGEFGGVIAKDRPEPTSRPSRRGDWLRQFDAGYCITDFEPLKCDRKTLIYTGTILWDIPNQGTLMSK